MSLSIGRWLPDRVIERLAHFAAGDHQNCALAFKLAERPITLTDAAERFDRAFGSLQTVELAAVLSQGPVRVVERHACVFDGQRFAHLVVTYKGAPVSLLIADEGSSSRSWWNRADVRGLQPDAGFQVATFRTARHAVFVVSSLAGSDVEEVATAVARPLTEALGGG